jgi:transposase-like protein
MPEYIDIDKVPELQPKNYPKCPRCGSDNTIKSGMRYNKKGVSKRYLCKICGTSFCNEGYYRGKHAISLVQYAVVLYREGYSYEKIQSRLKAEFGIYISRKTVGDWMKMMHVQPRTKSSGDQKNKIVRELIEIGVITTVRYASSFHPEKFLIIDNFVANLIGKQNLEFDV